MNERRGQVVQPDGSHRIVQITLDEYLLEEIDASAAALGETRSGFLATGARRRLEDA